MATRVRSMTYFLIHSGRFRVRSSSRGWRTSSCDGRPPWRGSPSRKPSKTSRYHRPRGQLALEGHHPPGGSYWSRMKDVSFCFEKELRVKNQNKHLFIRDHHCHLAVMAFEALYPISFLIGFLLLVLRVFIIGTRFYIPLSTMFARSKMTFCS